MTPQPPDPSDDAVDLAGRADTDAPAQDAALGEAAAVPASSPLPLVLDIECAARANYALHQNRVPLVSRLSLTNTGEDVLEDLRVSLSLANGEAEPSESLLSRIGPGETYNLAPDGPRLDGTRLAQRTERERTALIVRAESAQKRTAEDTNTDADDGAVVPAIAWAERRVELDLLPFDHWGGLSPCPELLAAFVTPNHPGLTPILRRGQELLRDSGDRDAIDGYQSASRTRAVRLAEVAFASIAERGIGYINPPASFERAGQRVRLVDQILRQQLGTCLDLSLMLAGMWEQSGLNPLILLFEDHALPAFWTHDEHFPEPAIDEPARLRKGVGLGELVVVESTVLTHREGTFAAAVEAATQRLAGAVEVCAVDVRTARRLGVRPLPLRVEQDQTSLAEDTVRQEVSGAAQTSLPAVELAERVSAAVDQAEIAPESSTGDRVDRWKRKLLDLSLRNRLLNFRETKRVVELSVPDIAALEDRLADGASFDVLPRPDRRNAEEESDATSARAFREAEFAEGRVFSTLTEAETSRRLLEIYRAAKSSIEETGANVLYLAVGMLRWRETPGAETVRSAPLILLPVTLVRRSAGSGYRYRVELTSEPLRPNVTLVEKLRVDFGMDVRALAEMPEDDNGIDVPLILRRFREAVRDAKGWEVEETAHLGLFSFSKFLMWHDLQQMGDTLRRQRLLGRMLRASESADGTDDRDIERPFPDAAGLDDSLAPGALLCTRDADSSQLVAVRAAQEGRTFVLEGPPGTGKSQTIANIIADALGNGKRVLFVAEKVAALSVVRRRLERDGLGPFCLELHSARASKKEVLRQLAEAVDAQRSGTPETWDTSCESLREVRERLNRYVRELHEPRASGESIYQMIGRLSVLGGGPRVDLGIDDYTSVSQPVLAEWRSRLASLMDVSGVVDPVGSHALRGIGRSEWSFALPEEARSAIMAAQDARGGLRDAVEYAASALCATDQERQIVADRVRALSRDEAGAFVACAGLLATCPDPSRDTLDAAASAGTVEVLTGWIERGREASRRTETLLSRYRPEFLDADLLGLLDSAKQASQKPAIVRWFFAGRVRKQIRPYCTGEPPAIERTIADLEEALALGTERRELARTDTEPTRCFGTRWRGIESDWDAFEAELRWSVRFHAEAAPLVRSDAGRWVHEMLARIVCDPARPALTGSAVGAAAANLVEVWSAWDSACVALTELLQVIDMLAWGRTDEPGWLERIEVTLAAWADNLHRLNDWCAWRRERQAACTCGLTALVEAYEAGTVARDVLGDMFERSYGERWLVQVADSGEAVRGFNTRAHTSAIERFRELDREVIRLTRRVVAGRLAERLPGAGASVSSSSEVGILRRELEKRARHMPTRRLIDSLPNLLPRLKPCFLMSPLSVAQYLDAGHPPFDLVVFDEASQIPVWDAIGSIARGTDAIVVGDSRQLPPTNFFGTVETGDDNESVAVPVDDELESILQECNASGVPSLRLKWHYRSRHESLITFSNHHYYDDELHTFPSPVAESPELGVSFRFLEDGVYDRGGARTNRAEAGAVVEEVVRLLGEPGATGSIGVVTFNAQQQGLIEDLFDEARREHPEIEPFFTGVDEPVFVKNLENVQGDERDTIIFSVGFGPDEAGRVSMNFGPLNIEGGERRLNVAITRARYRLVVFCSMQPEMIDLSRTRAVGVQHFKRFLMYAQRGPAALAEATSAHTEAGTPSALERAVRDVLTSRGWAVVPRVGLAGYRVDLGICDPEQPGEYIVGVECDGPMYRRASTARDRDRTRFSVLSGLGWRLVRVWSTAWRLDPDGCIAMIEGAIAQAQAERARAAENTTDAEDGQTVGISERESSAPPPETAQPETGDEADGVQEATTPVYQAAVRLRGVTSRSDIFQERTNELAVRALASIVSQEAPIVPELALRRLGEWFGVSRVTDRYRERFKEILGRAASAGMLFAKGDALWPAGSNPTGYRGVRTAGEAEQSQRDVEWVPLVERINAVRLALRAQIALPREELEREAARVLGYLRVTAKTREAMAEAIDVVVESDAASERDGMVIAD